MGSPQPQSDPRSPRAPLLPRGIHAHTQSHLHAPCETSRERAPRGPHGNGGTPGASGPHVRSGKGLHLAPTGPQHGCSCPAGTPAPSPPPRASGCEGQTTGAGGRGLQAACARQDAACPCPLPREPAGTGADRLLPGQDRVETSRAHLTSTAPQEPLLPAVGKLKIPWDPPLPPPCASGSFPAPVPAPAAVGQCARGSGTADTTFSIISLHPSPAP